MIEKQLIRCVRCNALALFSSVDRSPEYRWEQGKWKVLERDDQAQFLQAHRGHELEKLRIVKDSFISRQNYLEPVGTSYFEAISGEQCVVVKRSRETILAPQRYELIPGRLRLTPGELRIDGSAIQKAFEREFSCLQLPPDKVNRFVQQLEETVSRLNPEELKRVPFESHNPSLWYFYLDGGVVDRVLEKSMEFLNKREVSGVDEFLRKNLEEPLFMAVAEIDFQIESSQEHKKTEFQDP